MNTHERIPSGDHAAGAGINICSTISDMLSRIGDKWTIETVTALGKGPKRFNELRREMGEISQKMLSTTLRRLERDGFVSRHVLPTTPPQVSYTLTRLAKTCRSRYVRLSVGRLPMRKKSNRPVPLMTLAPRKPRVRTH
ncbi:MAG: helix-turn-helix domain-containing protein [Nitratireductor sp.]